MGLGNQAQYFPPLYHSGAVYQLVSVPYRQTQGGQHVQVFGLIQNGAQSVLCPLEEGVLQKQVAAGVACDAQLGQGQHLDPPGRRVLHQGDNLPRVVGAVRHLDLRRPRRHLDKAVPHSRAPFGR